MVGTHNLLIKLLLLCVLAWKRVLVSRIEQLKGCNVYFKQVYTFSIIHIISIHQTSSCFLELAETKADHMPHWGEVALSL